ncbi:MAG TPA: glycosyltransferase family 2 protein [Pyrinomonadaceae bacterium]|nr:glycosyltransferase family 2 protein [Pyrinomonadaceae bacterium]
MFSVAMCTYNGARFLGAQLASVAAQTLAPGELVVCDDRSTDETASIVREFASSAPFPVRLHVNEQNLGSTRNFERAVSLCAGELIALSDQDDVWLPHKLARLEQEFARDASALAVFSDAEVVDEETRPTGRGLWESVGVSAGELALMEGGRGVGELLRGATVTGATMAVRASLRGLALPFPADLPLIHDGWMVLLAACVGGVRPVPERLVLYRRHGSQQVGPLARPDAAGGLGAVVAGETLGALSRANPYDSTLSVARAARDRLAGARSRGLDIAKGARAARSLAELDSRIAHLDARRTLPRARLRRAAPVLKELLALRYHRFANGFASAAKDLLS